jgi:ATP-binding cassette subfamily C protein LapB
MIAKGLGNKIRSFLYQCGLKVSNKKVIVHLIILSFFINIFSLTLPLSMLQTYDRILPNASTHTLLLLVLLVMAAAIIEAFLRMLRASISAWSTIRQDYLTNVLLAKNLVQAKLGAQSAADLEPGLILIDFITKSRGLAEEQALLQCLDGIFVFLYLLLIAYIGGALVFIPLFFIGWLAYQFLSKDALISQQLTQKKRNYHAFLSFLVDTLAGVFTVKAFGLEPLTLRKSESIILNRAKTDHQLNHLNMQFLTLTQLFSQMIFFGTVGLGSILVIKGNLTIGGLAACTLLSGRCLQPISQILSMWRIRFDSRYTKQFVNKIKKLAQENLAPSEEAVDITGELEFKQISLNHADGQAIRSTNLIIKSNRCLAILDYEQNAYLLFYLIMNFIQPTAGTIEIDQQPLQSYPLEDLRRQITYLPHHPQIFQGTLLDNLTQFRKEKEPAVKSLMRELELEFLIQTYPDGYLTVIGPNASQMISEGHRMIINFIRALINAPKILLLNHITLFIDFQSRNTIIKLIQHAKTKMTVLIATQDLGLLNLGDYTLQLKAGSLAKVKHD